MYFTSPDDVADLIDHLSRDLDASDKGRIDFASLSAPTTPLLPNEASSTASSQPEGLSGFSQVTKPLQRKLRPAPLLPTRPIAVPAGGFSPKRQAFLRNYGNKSARSLGHRTALSSSSIPSADSPSAASFASSSGSQTRTVEERLQSLMDRLQNGDLPPTSSSS